MQKKDIKIRIKIKIENIFCSKIIYLRKCMAFTVKKIINNITFKYTNKKFKCLGT